MVKSQETRSQSQNEKIARQLLADRVEALLKGDQSRVAMKAESARKKRASKIKKSRRKYRGLDKEKEMESAQRAGEEANARGDYEKKEEEDDDPLKGNRMDVESLWKYRDYSG